MRLRDVPRSGGAVAGGRRGAEAARPPREHGGSDARDGRDGAWTMRTVALLRCSSKNQDQEMAAQRADIEAWCGQHDVEIAPEDWRLEPDVSGKAKVRTELQRVVDECREERVQRVVFADFQRAGRRGAETVLMLEQLAEWKVNLVFVRSGPLDMTTYQGRAWALIYAAMGLLKLDEVSTSTTSGMERAKAKGKHIGNPRLHWSDDLDAEILRLSAAGASSLEIATSGLVVPRRRRVDEQGRLCAVSGQPCARFEMIAEAPSAKAVQRRLAILGRSSR